VTASIDFVLYVTESIDFVLYVTESIDFVLSQPQVKSKGNLAVRNWEPQVKSPFHTVIPIISHPLPLPYN
jgi:hypothetical protein